MDRKLAEKEDWSGAKNSFWDYERLFANVMEFKYLGCILKATDDDWLVVVANQRKYRKKWAWLSRILVRKGVNVQTSGLFYKAVVQFVFRFGSEMWAVNPCIGRAMGGFHRRVARQTMGRKHWI